MKASKTAPAVSPAIEPGRPIIDPHLHLWDIPAVNGGLQEPQRFLLTDAVRTIGESGLAITHTVFVECHAMYRRTGNPNERSIGETEFATGMAAMSASGGYGSCRIAHRIVANVDLRLGDAAEPILERHRSRAGDRLRGIRMSTAYSDSGLFGQPCDPEVRSRLSDPRFLAGARVLARMGLSLDVWCLHPQLPQLAMLADQVPKLAIVLDHAGTPDMLSRDSPGSADALREWARNLAELARRPNVRVKLSGFGMDVTTPIRATCGSLSAEAMAEEWAPRIATIIDLFLPGRCMFASNYPPDQAAGSYGAIWDAHKRVAAGYSPAERDQLFRRTAAQTYGIDLQD